MRQGKTLEATDKGIRLIEIVHPQVKSPAMTGQWEARLQQIQRGKADLGTFLREIEEYVRGVVGNGNGSHHRSAPPPEPSPPAPLPPPPFPPHRERGETQDSRSRIVSSLSLLSR